MISLHMAHGDSNAQMTNVLPDDGRTRYYGRLTRGEHGRLCFAPVVLDDETPPGEFPIPICPGIGVVSTQQPDGRREDSLVVWQDEPGISLRSAEELGGTEAELQISGQVPGRQAEVTIYLRIDTAVFEPALLWGGAPKACPAGAFPVFAEKLVRVVCPSEGSEPVYKYPDAPVMSWAWKFVEQIAPGPRLRGDGKVRWRLRFVGGVERQHVVDARVDTDFEELGVFDRDTRESKSCPMAVWPPYIIPKWKAYSILFGDESNRADVGQTVKRYGPHVWVGTVTEVPGRPAGPDAHTVVAGVHSLLLNENNDIGAGPRFLVLGLDESGHGVFELLNEGIATKSEPAELAIDFGTSNSVVAHSGADGRGEAVNFGRGGGFACVYPRVLVGSEYGVDPATKKPRLETGALWLPSVDTIAFGGSPPSFTQVPSGLVVRYFPEEEPLVDSEEMQTDLEALRPFCSHTFWSPGLDFGGGAQFWKQTFNDELKWNDNTGATVAYLSLVLLWVIAQKRPDSGSFHVYATYPLAFESQQRETYGLRLTEACKRVSRWAGVPVALQPEANPPMPSVDESSAILNKGLETFQEDVTARDRAHLVFGSDLGGGTLDLVLAAVKGKARRIIATESIRAGADTLVRALLKRTLSGHEKGTGRNKMVEKAVLMREIRAGRLADAIKQGSFRKQLLKRTISWKGEGDRTASDFQARADIYIQLVVDYCARFLAGTLLDVDSIKWKLQDDTAGGGAFPKDYIGEDKAKRYAVVLRQSGNGWGFLDDGGHICGWSPSDFLSALKARCTELMQAERSVEPHWVPDATQRIHSKEETALGAYALHHAESKLVEGDSVAPNGWIDNVDDKVGPWWVLVGRRCYSSQGNKEDLPPEHAFYKDEPLQMSVPASPELAPAVDCARTVLGREEREKVWDFGQRPSREDLKAVQEAQRKASTGRSRELSTSRAFFERVIKELVEG